MSEEVLVLKNSLLDSYIQGRSGCLIKDDTDHLYNKMLNSHSFMPRKEAEYNFEHKQIIPYVVVHHKDNYLLLQRTSNQSEKRLHNKYSLGIGGHINPVEALQYENIIVDSMYRELNEEVQVNDHGTLKFAGVINDDSNSVSKVHLGLLYILEVLSPEFEVLEKDKMTAQWVSENDLHEYYDRFETWSQIVYDDYVKSKEGSKDSRVLGVK